MLEKITKNYIKNNLAYFLTAENKNICLFNCITKNTPLEINILCFYSENNFTKIVKEKINNKNISYINLENFDLTNLYYENNILTKEDILKIKYLLNENKIKDIILDYTNEELLNTYTKDIFKDNDFINNYNIILPFLELEKYPIKNEIDISSEIYINLPYALVNFDLIKDNNIEFIKNIEENTLNRFNLEKYINKNTNFTEIFRYFISKSTINNCIFLIEYCGKFINKKFYIYCIENLIFWHSKNNELIKLIIEKANILNEEINNILINYIGSFAYHHEKPTQEQQEQVKWFYNLFKNIITEETRYSLLYCSLWKKDFNKILTNFLINELDCDLGDLIIMNVKEYYGDETFNRLMYYLETFPNKITTIQLDEALIEAKKNKLSVDILKLLIKYGANENLLNIKTNCEGLNRFCKENPNLFTKIYRSKRDRILIKFLLEDLGNPQQNIKNIIHVTGSNGKGSTCSFMQSILEANGYSVNKFTSPSIIKENENYIILGKEIEDEMMYYLLQEVKKSYENVKTNEEYLKAIHLADEEDKKNGLKIDSKGYEGVLLWVFLIPMVILAFNKNSADYTIIEVVIGGLDDVTNIFTAEQTVATVLTYIQYGIGSNDGCMSVRDKNNKIENSNTATAYHKSMLGKMGIPMIVANQTDDVLTEIRRVAKDLVKTETFEYNKDWFLIKQTKNSFTLKIFNKNFIFNKSKIFVEDFQTMNTITAIATLLKLESKNILKLDTKLIQNGINNVTLIARPKKILKGNLFNFFKNNVEIITGVVKLNKSGIESIENIINKNNNFNNYFIYSSNNKDAYLSHKMYFFDFIQNQTQQNKDTKLIIYNKNDIIFKVIKNKLIKNCTPYIIKNNLSSAILYVKDLIKKIILIKKNRIFILSDSVEGFDSNIEFLNY